MQSNVVGNRIHSLLFACVPIKYMTIRTRYVTVWTGVCAFFDCLYVHTGLIKVHGCFTWRE